MKKILIVLTILFSNFVFSQEDLITKGFEAYSRGDYLIALKCFKKSCSLNSGDGCSNLGAMYQNGFGVKKDNFKAVELYQKSCSLNSGLGCSNLGAMYANGFGVKKDISKALEYFGKACDLRDDLGCQNYARLKQ